MVSNDCDCNSNPETPCMAVIRITASIDPVACDKASLDLIYNSEDVGKDRLIERIESRHGIRTGEHAEELGIEITNYELEQYLKNKNDTEQYQKLKQVRDRITKKSKKTITGYNLKNIYYGLRPKRKKSKEIDDGR